MQLHLQLDRPHKHLATQRRDRACHRACLRDSKNHRDSLPLVATFKPSGTTANRRSTHVSMPKPPISLTAVAACGVDKQSGNLRRIGTEVRGAWRGTDDRTTRGGGGTSTSGNRSLNLAQSPFIPPLLAITYNEVASVRKHNDSSLLIQRAARPRATIVPHTLLLGQSGNAKQGSNRF